MFNIIFTDYFFKQVQNFISIMQRYYTDFYSNTGLFNEDLIVDNYKKLYKNLGKEILSEIKNQCESGLLGRLVLRKDGDIEIILSSFKKRSFLITFYATKNNKKKEIVIYDLKINN